MAAFVPTMMTVCWLASMISTARRSPFRGASFLSRFSILRRLAWRRASGSARSAADRALPVVQTRAEHTPQGRVDLGPAGRGSCSTLRWPAWPGRRRGRRAWSVRRAVRRRAGSSAGNGAWSGPLGDDERVPGVGFRCSGSPGFRAAWPRRWARLCRRASSRTGRVHGNGVFGLADIQADEDINVFVVSDHLYLQSQQPIPVLDCPRCQSPASTLRTTIPICPASISGLSGTHRTPVTTPLDH